MKTKIVEDVRDIRKRDVVNSFFESLKEVRKSRPYATQDEVIKHAVSKNAPRFYVTFENARRFVSMLARKKKLPLINSNKLAMYKEIYHRYLQKVKDTGKRYKYIIQFGGTSKIYFAPTVTEWVDGGTVTVTI